MKITPRIIHCTEDEEQAARSLGKAVVALWSDLPQEVRDLLFQQALLVDGRQETRRLRHQIEAFILRCQGDLS